MKGILLLIVVFIISSGCVGREAPKATEAPIVTEGPMVTEAPMVTEGPKVEAPKVSPLVDVAFLESHLNDPKVRIVDVSLSALGYEAGHIPNALFLDWRNDISDLSKPERFLVAPKEKIEEVLGRLGVEKETTIVLYDNFKNSLSVKVYQAFKYYGHENVKILNGGADAWKSAGKAIVTDAPRITPTKYTITKTNSKIIVDIDYVKANLNKLDVAFIDARGQAMYNGSIPGKTFHAQQEYAKRGHIPGAINVFWQTNLNADGTFKTLDELKAMYEAKGITMDKMIATYCNEGIFASYDWFVLSELLGYPNVAVYEGSMIEWSNDPTTITHVGDKPVGDVYVAPPQAKAELIDLKGDKIGSATLTGTSQGVKVLIDAAKLPAGQHGLHIHAVGKCEPATNFTSAGGHFNPYGKKHGSKNPNGSHAGDLSNLVVGQDGTAKVELVAAQVTLGEGINSLFSVNGTALVIHANPDDEMTDPTGNSGARITCGVITK